MADSIYTFDPVPANNTALDSIPYGPNQLYHSQIDNWFRALGSKLAQFVDDLGAVNTVAGTGDAVTVTLASGITAYATGQFFRFIAGAANTGAATMNVNSIGIKAIRKISGGTDVALSAGDLAAGVTYELVYRASANAAAGAWVLVGSSVAAATTSAAGIVELATAQEALAASSSALALTPASIATLIQNINNNAFEITDLKGARLNMAGGIADAYDSETDVDTATSTNESYDATNDLYAPTMTSSAVSGATGTVIGTTITAGTGSNTPWDGDLSRTDANAPFYAGALTAVYLGKDWGLGNTKTIARYQIYGSSNNGLWSSSGSNTIKLQGSTDNFSSSIVDLHTATQTDANGLMTDVSSGITTSTAYRYHRIEVTKTSGENIYPVEVVFYESTGVNNMTLVSNAFTASAVPTQARVAVFIDPQVSITINTDFTAEVSRDGGTTWTAVTLALVSNPVGTVEQYEGTVSISSQPSGTSMKYRLKTLNNKDIDVTGVVFQWS